MNHDLRVDNPDETETFWNLGHLRSSLIKSYRRSGGREPNLDESLNLVPLFGNPDSLYPTLSQCIISGG